MTEEEAVKRPYNMWVLVGIPTVAVSAIVLLFLIRKQLLNLIGLPNVNTAEYFSTIFAIVGGVILLLLGFSFWPDFDRVRTAMLVEVSGACVGWVLGMFFSPTSQNEQQTFVNAKTALVGIVSGYILSKLQSVFDTAMKDGRILTQKVALLAMMFLSSLILSTAAVYSNRTYADRPVIISKGSSKMWSTDNGKDALPLSQVVTFLAEARLPMNTAVIWSMDPDDRAHGKINAQTGEYTAPDTMPDSTNVDVFATSQIDKTKVGRFKFELIKSAPASRTTSNAETSSQPKSSATGAK